MRFIIVIISSLISVCANSQIINTYVENKIVYGDLAGNRDLSFGVKNILDELVQDEGYDLSENSESILMVDLLYFDVIRKSTNAAIFSKTNNQVEIIAEATYNGKKTRVKATADNIITSTIVLNNSGTFNQQSVSVALKKVCEQIIKKLKL
jgi:uncharacterized lipoprotein YajG